MENQSFKPGDVVMLKSGSPEMTVTYTEKPSQNSQTYVACVFYVDGKFDSMKLPESALIMAKDAPKPSVKFI